MCVFLHGSSICIIRVYWRILDLCIIDTNIHRSKHSSVKSVRFLERFNEMLTNISSIPSNIFFPPHENFSYFKLTCYWNCWPIFPRIRKMYNNLRERCPCRNMGEKNGSIMRVPAMLVKGNRFKMGKKRLQALYMPRWKDF